MAAIGAVAGGGALAAGLATLGNAKIRSLIDYVKNSIDGTIQDTIATADGAGMQLLITAGDQIERVIDAFKNAYRTELDYTLSAASIATQNAFNQVVSIGENFFTQAEADLAVVAAQATALFYQIPFVSQQSFLTKTRPLCFVVTNLSGRATITFDGTFPCVGQNGMIPYLGSVTPTLKFGEVAARLINSTIQQLQFEFPLSVFGSLPTATSFPRTHGQLNAPWWNGGLVDFISNNAIYDVTLTALPRIAGVITQATFRYTAMVPHVVTEMKTFADRQKVKKWNTAKANKYYPDAGCQFDTTTQPNITTNPSPSYTTVDFTQDVIAFAVYYNGEDWITFSSSLRVAQRKTVMQPELKDRVDIINMEIPWGEQRSLPGRPGETLLSFTFQTFKGGTITFTAPNFGYNGFLDVSSAADGGAGVRADIDHFA